MPLELLAPTALRPDGQCARPSTSLTRISSASHVAAAFVKFRRVDLRAAETLSRILGTCNGVAPAVTKGDASFVGHVGTIEVGPLREDARIDGVGVTAGIGPGGIR